MFQTWPAFKKKLPSSFIPQRVDRVEVRCLPCRIDPEDDSHDAATGKSDCNPIIRNDRWNFQKHRSYIAAQKTEHDSDYAAQLADDDRFKNKLPEDIRLSRANRFTNAD